MNNNFSRQLQAIFKTGFKSKTILCAVMALFLMLTVGTSLAASKSSCAACYSAKITKSEIRRAQRQWAKSLVAIGNAYTNKQDYKKIAKKSIARLYAYNIDNGTVLFKPTKTTTNPFRGTAKGALSYFVGGNRSFREDKGFALQPWRKVTFRNDAYYFHQGVAVVMGTYTFVATDNTRVRVKYTFGYVKDTDGNLKIFLQHSSLPHVK